MTAPEIVLPFSVARELIRPAHQWRSTWVVASIQTLRERGHFDRYEALLLPSYRDVVLEAVAGMWLPMAPARAHYQACDRLGLTLGEATAMGRAAGARAQGSVLGTAVRAARGAGATPWSVVPLLHRLWQRGADGGDTQIEKLGPKEGRMETVGCELFDVPYFRRAFAGVMHGILELFCHKLYVHDETPTHARGAIVLRLQWA